MEPDSATARQPAIEAIRAASLRVLHVIDPGSAGGGACTLRLLADHLAATQAWDHTVLVAGHRRHLQLAQRCGVAAAGTLPPLRLALMRRSSIRALHAALKAYERRLARFDLIHAWTIASADIARVTTTRRPVLATIPLAPVNESERRALRRVAFAADTVVAATSSVLRECLDAGIPRRPLVDIAMGVNLERGPLHARAAIRTRWNAIRDEFLIGLIGQPTSWTDVRLALAIVAPLMAVPHPIRLVAFSNGARRAQATRWTWRLNWPKCIIVDDDLAEPWRVVHGLDAALAMGAAGEDGGAPCAGATSQTLDPSKPSRDRSRPSMGVLPILHAMAAGLPVITDIACDQLAEIVVDGRSGFRVLSNDISGAMERVLRLIVDPALRKRMGIAARESVMTRASIEHFSAGISRAVGRLLSIPAPQSEERVTGPSRTSQRASA